MPDCSRVETTDLQTCPTCGSSRNARLEIERLRHDIERLTANLTAEVNAVEPRETKLVAANQDVAPRPWRLWKAGERSELPHIADAGGTVVARAEGNIWVWQDFIAPVIIAAVNGLSAETVAAIDWRREVTSILEHVPGAIRVREGGGPENLAMSLATTVAHLVRKAEKAKTVGEQPISTAPKTGNFLVSLEDCPELWWPAYRTDGGPINSNAHGILNQRGHGRPTVATHWRPMPARPGSSEEPTPKPERQWRGIVTHDPMDCSPCDVELRQIEQRASEKATDLRKTRYCDYDLCADTFDPAHSNNDH